MTIVTTTLFSIYMLFDAGEWLASLMQFTYMSNTFKGFITLLAVAGGSLAWISEQRLFPTLARTIGKIQGKLMPKRRKQKKEYKQLLIDMRV